MIMVFNHEASRLQNRRTSRKCQKLTSHGKTTETPLLLEGNGFANSGVPIDDNRVEDEAVLVALHLADHVGLSIGGTVVVDHTQTTLESHVDGHLVLCDRVHGRRDEGGLESDPLGDRRIKHDLGGGKPNVAREQQEVIVSQTTMLGRVHELMKIQPIAALVLLEHLQGLGEVRDLGGAIDGGSGSHCGGLFFSLRRGVV